MAEDKKPPEFDEAPEGTEVSITLPPPTEPVEEVVIVFRSGKMVGDKLEYELKVKNQTAHKVSSVKARIETYPTDTLLLEGDQDRTVDIVEPGESGSIVFLFAAVEDNVEGEIHSAVSYTDHTERVRELEVSPYVIRVVYNLLEPMRTTLDEFEDIIKKLTLLHDVKKLDWNPEAIFFNAEVLLRARNFHIVDKTESVNETQSGPNEKEYTGELRGLARHRHTGKKTAVIVKVAGPVNGKHSNTRIEAYGDDVDMLSGMAEEISDSLDSRACMNCGAFLNPDEVATVMGEGDGLILYTLECPYCWHWKMIEKFRW
ncbi:MAG: hypothetical protein JSW61_03845 [Candidatus Thorarchaeota archaeon]|nr:MAG: hypothetical protein JSW61_03845 [Candidatus Thorarchaeota archaeon]